MRIAIERRPAPHEAAFLKLLADSCKRLGHEVKRVGGFPQVVDGGLDLFVRWGAAHGLTFDGPNLYAELGWLPRWHYQLSHTGINAKHHLAAPTLRPLTEAQEREVENHLRECRSGHNCPFPYADPRVPPAENVPADGFILAPLQMPQDVSMQDAPERLRDNQGFIDAVAELESAYPVIHKAHCHSGAGFQMGLKMRRPEDRLAAHSEGTIHQYLKHPACKGVVVINSNSAVDALLWGVPVTTLGRGFWGESWPAPHRHTSYVFAMMQAQWKLEDAANILRVTEAIDQCNTGQFRLTT